MTGATARAELREARTKGFCPYCLARGDGATLTHQPDCKIVRDAGARRTTR